MRKIVFVLVFLGINTMVFSQNTLLDRKFWNETTSVEQVKEEIAKGNDPTALNAASFDPTVMAITANSPFETIVFLLEIEGNDINKVTHDSRNYLMWAGMKGNLEVIEEIINRGGDVNVLDSKGNNLQTFTAGGGVTNKEVYELYKKQGLKLDQPNRNGVTILHNLAQNISSFDELDYFLQEGLDIQAKDKNGNTLIHYAASQGNTQLIQEFIKEGLDFTTKNKQDETALFFAARGKRGHQNQVEIFKSLVKLNLDLKETNKKGENLLHLIALNNPHQEVFDFLISNQVDIQKVDEEGNLPVMNALVRNNQVAFAVLYPSTKEKMQVNKEGYSLFTYALRTKNSEITEKIKNDLGNQLDYTLLDAEGNNLITHLVATYDSKNKDFFTHYFEFLSQKIKPQNQTLHIAVLKGDTYLIEKLIASGVDINAKNQQDLTPLQLAAMKSHDLTVLKLLVNKGADKSIQTDFDETAYDLAKENELLKEDIEFLK